MSTTHIFRLQSLNLCSGCYLDQIRSQSRTTNTPLPNITIANKQHRQLYLYIQVRVLLKQCCNRISIHRVHILRSSLGIRPCLDGVLREHSLGLYSKITTKIFSSYDSINITRSSKFVPVTYLISYCAVVSIYFENVSFRQGTMEAVCTDLLWNAVSAPAKHSSP